MLQSEQGRTPPPKYNPARASRFVSDEWDHTMH